MVVGSLALGVRIATNMRGRLNSLRELERILGYIDGELRCRHSVLYEAMYNVSLKSGQPYRLWLGRLSKELEAQGSVNDEASKYKDFYTLWCESLTYLMEETLLNSKDISQLCDVGKALGYLDIESQQMNLNLERELIHKHILELDKDINARMKNAIVLCFLGGIMTVIALL